jgi:hypothetical protein
MKDDYAKLSPKQREILENSPWVAARRELVAMGLVRDSGRRRDGMIVWELAPLGKEVAERLEQPPQAFLALVLDQFRKRT